MTLSAAVMAHPDRADMVTDLLARLDRPVPVAWDEKQDRHDTGIRALRAHDSTATHHLVIQDDALPCIDLLASIERALAYVPDGHPASFYIGRVRPFRREIERAVAGAEGQASWLRFPGPYWGPAVVVPVADIPALDEWWSGDGAGFTNYDRRIARFFQLTGRDCWYSWPSLVDHRGDDSLVTGHKTARHAHKAVGPGVSGLTVDWSGLVLTLDQAQRLDAQRQREAMAARRRNRTTANAARG